MKIAIFNVKYSPNLGDGLLAECLEAELRAASADIEIVPIDLAGRRAYGEGDAGRRLKLMLLERLPSSVRRAASRLVLRRLTARRLAPEWRRALEGVDVVIVGGGNLFADADLNFPMKISAALREVAARGLPVGVFGVGATRNWSPEGTRLFGAALANVRLVVATVRDDRSRLVWNDMLSAWGVQAAGLAHDPGMLACRHFARGAPSGDGRAIGFCITDPLALRYHATTGIATHRLGGWYGLCIAALVDAGYRVTLFTNGSPEDHAYLASRAPAWVANGRGAVGIAQPLATPAALATFASGCDLVVAHRMHACIAAWSFRVPSIGLAWDTKLDSFFSLTGRDTFMIDPARMSARDVAVLADRAIAVGVDAAKHADHVARGVSDVASLAGLLADAVGQRAGA